MSLNKEQPVLWSDFDGTAVELVPIYKPRNWWKYPVTPIEGYNEFLQGVEHGGIAIGGIASQRQNLSQRRNVTTRTIRFKGIKALEDKPVKLMGGESGKAAVVVEESKLHKGVLIDDVPYSVGPFLLDGLYSAALSRSEQAGQDIPPLHVVLGAVSHRKTDGYLDLMEGRMNLTKVADPIHHEDGSRSFVGEGFTLDVMKLQPYSYDAGVAFAEQVLDRQPQPL